MNSVVISWLLLCAWECIAFSQICAVLISYMCTLKENCRKLKIKTVLFFFFFLSLMWVILQVVKTMDFFFFLHIQNVPAASRFVYDCVQNLQTLPLHVGGKTRWISSSFLPPTCQPSVWWLFASSLSWKVQFCMYTSLLFSVFSDLV